MKREKKPWLSVVSSHVDVLIYSKILRKYEIEGHRYSIEIVFLNILNHFHGNDGLIVVWKSGS